jgi:phosphoglycerate kinase
MQTLDNLLNLSILPRRALVRVDYNISIGNDGSASDAEMFRINASLDTVLQLRDAGIQPILISHYGRSGDAISVLVPILQKLYPIMAIESWNDDIAAIIQSSDPDTVILLPNSRTHSGEESGTLEFAQLLASCADVYVNDAFSASHRDHTSITGVSRLLPCYVGRQMIREIDQLKQARNHTENRLVIIGGAKFDTKLSLIQFFLDSGSRVCVVGALAHSIYTARGMSVGQSFTDTNADVSQIAHHPMLWVPGSVQVQSQDGNARECTVSEIDSLEKIVDAGGASMSELSSFIIGAKTVIWNGPLGIYESGFCDATNSVINTMATTTAFRVVGGGDTLTCLPQSAIQTICDFASTGGGAMLQYLLDGTLVGIDALETPIKT